MQLQLIGASRSTSIKAKGRRRGSLSSDPELAATAVAESVLPEPWDNVPEEELVGLVRSHYATRGRIFRPDTNERRWFDAVIRPHYCTRDRHHFPFTCLAMVPLKASWKEMAWRKSDICDRWASDKVFLMRIMLQAPHVALDPSMCEN